MENRTYLVGSPVGIKVTVGWNVLVGNRVIVGTKPEKNDEINEVQKHL